MDASQTQHYHIVKFLSAQNNGLSKVVCIPASWIRWADTECSTVLTAYPVEPSAITRERIKNYENPSEDWNSYLVQVKYSTDFYDKVIHCVNHGERKAEESSGSKMTVTDTESPHRSYLSVFQKWVSTLTDTIDPNCSMVNETDECPMLQSESTRSVIDLDSDDDVPWNLSMSSSNSHSINDREHCLEELLCPEVIITEFECPGSSTSFNASQHPKMNENNTFSSGFHRWFLDLAGPSLPMMDRVDEISKLNYEAFRIVGDQGNKNGNDDDGSRDWCMSSPRVDRSFRASSLLQDLVTNS